MLSFSFRLPPPPSATFSHFTLHFKKPLKWQIGCAALRYRTHPTSSGRESVNFISATGNCVYGVALQQARHCPPCPACLPARLDHSKSDWTLHECRQTAVENMQSASGVWGGWGVLLQAYCAYTLYIYMYIREGSERLAAGCHCRHWLQFIILSINAGYAAAALAWPFVAPALCTPPLPVFFPCVCVFVCVSA